MGRNGPRECDDDEVRRIAKTAVRSGLKRASVAIDAVRPRAAGVTVLIYHRVGAGSGGEVDLDTAAFDEQMAELADGDKVVDLDDAVARLGRTLHDGEGVVITFDDGTPDVIENALPILEKYRLPMTLYLATSFVEEQRGFWDPADQPLSWSALSDALSTGLVTIGSHTHTHALLDRLPAAEIADELDRSIDLIGDRLGVEARHFAYPKALPPSPAADAAVRERFASAAIAGTRPNPYGATDAHLLNRSPIQRSDGMQWFRRKAAGGMWAEDAMRRAINRVRYAGATR